MLTQPRSRAFAKLISDQQFAALGLTLFSTLAKLKCIVGRLPADELTEAFQPERLVQTALELGEDLGESIIRPDHVDNLARAQLAQDHHAPGPAAPGAARLFPGNSSVQPSASNAAASLTAEDTNLTRKPRKKRRRNVDVIDDLFDRFA